MARISSAYGLNRPLKITIVASKLAALQDQTRQLVEAGFTRQGHIELTFLADTVQPTTLYLQKLTRQPRAADTQTKENPTK